MTPERCRAIPSRMYTATHPHGRDFCSPRRRETSVSRWLKVKNRRRFPSRSGRSGAEHSAPRRPGQRGRRPGREPPRGAAAAAPLPRGRAPSGLEGFFPAIPFPGKSEPGPAAARPLPFPPRGAARPGPSARGGSRHADPESPAGPAERRAEPRRRAGKVESTIQIKLLLRRLIESQQTPAG